MRSAGNFGSEWGYLAPAPSFMRTARIVLVATAIGATAGAGVVLSLADRSAPESDRTAAAEPHAIVTSVQAATVVTPPAANPAAANPTAAMNAPMAQVPSAAAMQSAAVAAAPPLPASLPGAAAAATAAAVVPVTAPNATRPDRAMHGHVYSQCSTIRAREMSTGLYH